MQGVLNDFQGTGEGGAGGTIGPGPGPHGLMPGSSDQPAAFFEVIGPPVEKKVPLPDGLSLHPGMGGPDGDVQPSQISSQFGIRFQVNTLRDRAPVPQFVIGGKEFDVQSIFDVVESNSAAQWTLTSNMNYFHPFHVHVNPVQVKLVDLGSYIYGSDLFRRAINRTNAWPANMWRDTLFIPPYGAVVTWSKFNARFPGKTLFHCHFLDHEDQGMIAAFMVAQPGGFFFGASGGACISRQNAEYDTSQDTQITSAEQCEAAARSLTAGSVAQVGSHHV
jgi:FtsP/CotA-like multicopper oxidase with cupredoxin domain